MRLFVAVDPPPAVRDRLRSALVPMRKLAPRARWVDPASTHVTLAFLGDLEDDRVPALSDAIGAVARLHAPIDARFGGAGAFGGHKPRVLWAGLTAGAEALSAAQRELVVALAPFGYVPEQRGFSAHLTLARAGDRGGDTALAACASALATEDFGPARFESMVLYRSDLSPRGSTYTPLATLAFGALAAGGS